MDESQKNGNSKVTKGRQSLSPATEDRSDSRATFYFDESQLLELEILMLRIRTQHRAKVGKSELMRLALNRLLALKVDEIAGLLAE